MRSTRRRKAGCRVGQAALKYRMTADGDCTADGAPRLRHARDALTNKIVDAHRIILGTDNNVILHCSFICRMVQNLCQNINIPRDMTKLNGVGGWVEYWWVM
jgi:hypothetical protein